MDKAFTIGDQGSFKLDNSLFEYDHTGTLVKAKGKIFNEIIHKYEQSE